MFVGKSLLSKRMSAGIMLVMVLVFMLFSTFYIVAEADHDCAGEDCPVCACLQQCENTLSQIGFGAATAVFSWMPLVSILLLLCFSACNPSQGTLVSLKIRLNN